MIALTAARALAFSRGSPTEILAHRQRPVRRAGLRLRPKTPVEMTERYSNRTKELL